MPPSYDPNTAALWNRLMALNASTQPLGDSNTTTPQTAPQGAQGTLQTLSDVTQPLRVNPNVKFQPSMGAAKSALQQTGAFVKNTAMLGLPQTYQNIKGAVAPFAGGEGFADQKMRQQTSDTNAALAQTIGSLVRSGHLDAKMAMQLLAGLPDSHTSNDASLIQEFANAALGTAGAAAVVQGLSPLAHDLANMPDATSQRANAALGENQALLDKTKSAPNFPKLSNVPDSQGAASGAVPSTSGMSADPIQQRLEELRNALREENISYGELAELQSLAPHIDPSDTELLEAAGVPEGDTGAGGNPASQQDYMTAIKVARATGRDEMANELQQEFQDKFGISLGDGPGAKVAGLTSGAEPGTVGGSNNPNMTPIQRAVTAPTISQGQTDDLIGQVEGYRLWRSRMGVEDGMPYDNQLTIEKLINGKWETVREINPAEEGGVAGQPLSSLIHNLLKSGGGKVPGGGAVNPQGDPMQQLDDTGHWKPVSLDNPLRIDGAGGAGTGPNLFSQELRDLVSSRTDLKGMDSSALADTIYDGIKDGSLRDPEKLTQHILDFVNEDGVQRTTSLTARKMAREALDAVGGIKDLSNSELNALRRIGTVGPGIGANAEVEDALNALDDGHMPSEKGVAALKKLVAKGPEYSGVTKATISKAQSALDKLFPDAAGPMTGGANPSDLSVSELRKLAAQLTDPEHVKGMTKAELLRTVRDLSPDRFSGYGVNLTKGEPVQEVPAPYNSVLKSLTKQTGQGLSTDPPILDVFKEKFGAGDKISVYDLRDFLVNDIGRTAREAARIASEVFKRIGK